MKKHCVDQEDMKILMFAILGDSDSVLVKLPKREICRLMLRMLSPSTCSESLRFRHVFVPCDSDAKSHGCETFTCALQVMCVFPSVYISAGPLIHICHHIGTAEEASLRASGSGRKRRDPLATE